MAGVGETEKVETATDVLKQITAIPEQAIPSALLRNAQGLAVIPAVIKAGLFVAGSYGKGILTIRDNKGQCKWTLSIPSGVGFGLQRDDPESFLG